MANNENLISKEKTLKQNRVWVRIASACNNRCIFCLDYYAHNGTFPSEEEVKKQILNGFKKGYDNRVIISGGEASINPKFVDYIKYAKDIGYNRIQTVTNGNMFANSSFCDNVFKAGLEEVTFSFHGHKEVLHDYLVGTKGAFKKSLRGLIYIKKNYPNVIVNIDIVVNKVNISFLRDIVRFFIKLGVYEYDILQIVPFGKGFQENKDKLFYNIEENIINLHDTWELSRIPGMYMWTNRFPAEAFEGFEDLIQDPRKLKGEVMGESYSEFKKFIESGGKQLPDCYGDACKYCFQNNYCHHFLDNFKKHKIDNIEKYHVINGEEFPSQVYDIYGKTKDEFKKYLQEIKKPLINIPKCLGGTGIYQTYNDIKQDNTIEDYTEKYIRNLYRKKSIKCRGCKDFEKCEGIHINFIRSYGFDIFNILK